MNKRGAFWIVDGKLLAFPFDETETEGVAKSGNTFNHRLLWEYIKPCIIWKWVILFRETPDEL